MESKIVDSPLSHFAASFDGRKAILHKSLRRLALALGMERRLPYRQIQIMADDLASEWNYSLEDLVDAIFNWRRGAIPGLSERELLRFPRTVQVLNAVSRRWRPGALKAETTGARQSSMVH